jgi:hypothetical protein
MLRAAGWTTSRMADGRVQRAGRTTSRAAKIESVTTTSRADGRMMPRATDSRGRRPGRKTPRTTGSRGWRAIHVRSSSGSSGAPGGNRGDAHLGSR